MATLNSKEKKYLDLVKNNPIAFGLENGLSQPSHLRLVQPTRIALRKCVVCFVVSGVIISRRLFMISHTFPGSNFLHEAFPSLIPASASALWFRAYAGGCASDPLVPYFAFFPQLGYDGYTTQ